jgi:nucleolar protein 15
MKVKKEKTSTADLERGFVYIGHLPHGFYEQEIRSYFSQFGKIARVRLSRSKQSGNCRGYGFIEFKKLSDAKIAAETMNNYLMFNKLLKCHLIPKEQLHGETFNGSDRQFRTPLKSWNRSKFNAKKSADKIEVGGLKNIEEQKHLVVSFLIFLVFFFYRKLKPVVRIK